MRHPSYPDQYTYRYCNLVDYYNYVGDEEPTRQPKNGETEDCVTFVFVPQNNNRGLICMADDYCSTQIGFICEISNRLSMTKIK